MKYFILLSFLFSNLAQAMPKHIEVWFLSIDKQTSLLHFIENLEKQTPQKKYAQSGLQCQPMGDYCFDPQIGLYKKGAPQPEAIDYAEAEKNEKYNFMDTPSSIDRDMINCDKASFFDVFCGKSQKKVKQGRADLEVWIDVSSTMKQVDFQGFDKKCSRELFLEKLNQTCPMNKKMKVYYFEEYRKEAGSFDRSCLSGGLNNMKRIVQDLKKSETKNVIIITDIFEADVSFIDAIEATGRATIKGLEKPLYAKDISNELKRVRKFCQ